MGGAQSKRCVVTRLNCLFLLSADHQIRDTANRREIRAEHFLTMTPTKWRGCLHGRGGSRDKFISLFQSHRQLLENTSWLEGRPETGLMWGKTGGTLSYFYTECWHVKVCDGGLERKRQETTLIHLFLKIQKNISAGNLRFIYNLITFQQTSDFKTLQILQTLQEKYIDVHLLSSSIWINPN